jgi:hypothetical protein
MLGRSMNRSESSFRFVEGRAVPIGHGATI